MERSFQQQTFTATNGTSIVLASGATVGDTVDVVAFATQTVANVYTQTQSDARYLQLTGGTLTGNLIGTTATLTGQLTVQQARSAVMYRLPIRLFTVAIQTLQYVSLRVIHSP